MQQGFVKGTGFFIQHEYRLTRCGTGRFHLDAEVPGGILVSCITNNLTLDWPISDAEGPHRSARIPKGLCKLRRGGSAPKETNLFGASVFWHTAAAKCDGDGRHRLTRFAAPVHPECARPM